MVTFKKTDPLFVFDLVDPEDAPDLGRAEDPRLLDLHAPHGRRNHLLTIGYDAADQGDFAWFTGVLLQIFDVSDPAQPTWRTRRSSAPAARSSEALTNHLAFNYFAPRDLLPLPMTVCEAPPGSTNLFERSSPPSAGSSPTT